MDLARDESSFQITWCVDPFVHIPHVPLWGVAPTGDVHLGYMAFVCILKRLRAVGASPVILIANYHAYLDGGKTEWEALDERTLVYRQFFAAAGLDNVIESKDVYVCRDYVEALLRVSAEIGVETALAHSGRTLRTPAEDARVADLIYIVTQVLDVQYFEADAVLCGNDEADIYRLAQRVLPKQCSTGVNYVFAPMCPGIIREEMHASDPPYNKICVADSHETIREKVLAHSEKIADGSATRSLFSYCRFVLFPLAGLDELASEIDRFDDTPNISRVAELVTEGISALLEPWREA